MTTTKFDWFSPMNSTQPNASATAKTVDNFWDEQPNATVIAECGEDYVEVSASILSENGYGSRSLSNPENAGPFIEVTANELAELNSM